MMKVEYRYAPLTGSLLQMTMGVTGATCQQLACNTNSAAVTQILHCHGSTLVWLTLSLTA